MFVVLLSCLSAPLSFWHKFRSRKMDLEEPKRCSHSSALIKSLDGDLLRFRCGGCCCCLLLSLAQYCSWNLSSSLKDSANLRPLSEKLLCAAIAQVGVTARPAPLRVDSGLGLINRDLWAIKWASEREKPTEAPVRRATGEAESSVRR